METGVRSHIILQLEIGLGQPRLCAKVHHCDGPNCFNIQQRAGEKSARNTDLRGYRLR